MSATSSSSQSAGIGDGPTASPVPASEIDASCRGPVLLLFLSAVVWLVIASVFGMIATLKFHAPNLLADCPWFTYGRVHPAHLDGFIYGFGVQAGLGVALWLVARLGRTTLAFGPVIMAGTKIWNLGVLLGIAGILCGDSTGFQWLEMPRLALVMLFTGYALIALGATLTLHQRRERQLYISQWFITAALFWFPWIFSTASLLLVARPVRGVLQAAIDWWYMNNLATVWFGFIGIAAAFYFIPKATRRPLHSHYLGIFIFWTLALFGSAGGIPAAAPLPAWMAALSIAAKILVVVPALGIAINVCKTMGGDYSQLGQSRPFKFILFGILAFVVAELAAAVASLMRFSLVTEFSWFVPALSGWFLYGFFAMTVFGAMYYIVPLLLQIEFPKPGLICAQFVLSGFGILFYAVPLAIGGIKQGMMLNDPKIGFPEVMASSVLWLRISTMGELLMVLGNLLLLLHLAAMLFSVARSCALAAWAANTKTAEVTP